ncbi:hypothetical protein RRG08_023999 [Elysia crispata]|uniref:Neurotransmitter-gated ion-channel transmembrane domain-containing protein n=1 Tax=Elysia crispata TaxID=231223 RepID=A0AAE0YP03_9GAST|nr:hypothetical protein RRG08_023999 [Elysia crispata]
MTAFETETSDIKTYFGTNAGWIVEEGGCSSSLSNSTQFPTITYVLCHVRLIRRSAFYVINLMCPMALTSVMTLIVFWILPEEREKVSFVTSVFMSTSLYLGFIQDRLPRSMETTPYLNLLLIATMATAFVLQYSKKRTTQQGQSSEDKDPSRGVVNDLDLGVYSKRSNFENKTISEIKTDSSVKELDAQTGYNNGKANVKHAAEKQRQKQCCSILCFGNSNDEDEPKVTLDEKLRKFLKLPRTLIKQNKVIGTTHEENDLNQSNIDETPQNTKHSGAFPRRVQHQVFSLVLPYLLGEKRLTSTMAKKMLFLQKRTH